MSLNVLQTCMNQSYSSFESPMLPNFSIGTVCVGQIDGHWYRLQVIEYQPDATACVAKYLDFGGFCEIQTTELRQIRTDFMTVPFQAIECLLADIKPKGKFYGSFLTIYLNFHLTSEVFIIQREKCQIFCQFLMKISNFIRHRWRMVHRSFSGYS